MTDVNYRLTLLKEQIDLIWQFLLLRLHLKTVSVEDYYQLKRRAEAVQTKIKVAEDKL